MKLLAAIMITTALIVGGVQPSAAGPVVGKGPQSGNELKDRPNKKPVRCKGLINMSNGLVLPTGKYAAAIKYTYVHKEDLYENDDKKIGNYGGKFDRVNHMAQLVAKAGLFDNFEARVMLPFFDKQVKRKSGGPIPTHTNTAYNMGVGDMVVMARYALMSQRKGDWLNLAFGAGVKLPTGDSDKENVRPFSVGHKYMGPGFQLGTGSWDPKFELGATKFFGKSRVDAHCMFTMPGQGDHGSRKGNQLKADLGYGYALNRLFDVELELNYVDQDAHVYDHSRTVNTGGQTLYVTPGVHWKITDSMHFSVGTPIVVYRNMNGQTNTPDRMSQYGIGEDFKVISRFGISF